MDVFIYHLYDWSIREAAAFRDTNGLGNLQIFTDDCNIGMVVGGLLYIAFPILIVIGIITLLCR